jgi:hypothetical protein
MLKECQSCNAIVNGCFIVKYDQYKNDIKTCPCQQCILKVNCSEVCLTRFNYFIMTRKKYSDPLSPINKEWNEKYGCRPM